MEAYINARPSFSHIMQIVHEAPALSHSRFHEATKFMVEARGMTGPDRLVGMTPW